MKSHFKVGLRRGAAACGLLLLAACGGGGGGGATPAPTPIVPAVPDPVLRVGASAAQVYAGEYVQFTAGDTQPVVSVRWEVIQGTKALGLFVEKRHAVARG